MSFEEACSIFTEKHLTDRTGERRGRLDRGHSHAEALFLRNVWWRVQGSFDDLHPEFDGPLRARERKKDRSLRLDARRAELLCLTEFVP